MIRPSETGQLITEDGQPVTAGNAEPPRGEHSGVHIYTREEAPMAKADKDGVYRLGKTHIKVRKGGIIPAGAEPVEDKRAKPAAPENKSKAGAPENRAAKKD